MLSSMSMARKLLAALVLAAAVLLMVGGVAWSSAHAIQTRLDDATNHAIPSLLALAQVDEAQLAIADCIHGALLRHTSTDEHRKALAKAAAKRAAVGEGVKAFEAQGHDPETLRLWAAWKAPFDEWISGVDRTISMLEERDLLADGGRGSDDPDRMAVEDQAWAAYQAGAGVLERAAQAIVAVKERTIADAQRNGEDGTAAAASAMITIAVAVGLATVGLLAVGLFLSRRIAATVSSLIGEAGRLRDAVAAGSLDVRGERVRVDREFRPIVDGINEMMDAFVLPIRATADAIGRIARGDIPARLAERYQGDFNGIQDNLNRAIDAVNALVEDASSLAKAGVEGRLATRADLGRHEGDFRRVVKGVNDTLDAFAVPTQLAASYIAEIARGNVPPHVTADLQGDFAPVKENLNLCIDAIARLVSDAELLATAGVEGRLGTRADPSRHLGDFRKIVEGVNRCFDAVAGTLEMATRKVDAISRGAIPEPIREECRGDYARIQQSLNTCIEAINRLVLDAGDLVEAAVGGRLTTRADPAKHQGDFRRIVEGINQTLDAIVAPLDDSAAVLERLARRELSARATGSYPGDYARVQQSLNGTAEALDGALSQVASAVEQVSGAATQIASSSQAVASGASEQASALEETTSTLKSVAAMTGRAADEASRANGLVQEARGAATGGALSVERMQGAMTKIRASAEGTSQIIRDINDIAFQTNLLALNAAVEAARAGDAGRGFAVVAEEVRSLALRSKEAASKTEALIRESVRQAGEGELTAREVAGKLTEIVVGVAKVSEIVSEIATAAKAQAAGIEQVSRAVTEMDRVTQQNAASAEQSSSAASELSGQAEELASMVATFQLGSERAAAAAAARPTAPSSRALGKGEPPSILAADTRFARRAGAAPPAT